jgi:hypothetical protein
VPRLMAPSPATSTRRRPSSPALHSRSHGTLIRQQYDEMIKCAHVHPQGSLVQQQCERACPSSGDALCRNTEHALSVLSQKFAEHLFQPFLLHSEPTVSVVRSDKSLSVCCAPDQGRREFLNPRISSALLSAPACRRCETATDRHSHGSFKIYLRFGLPLPTFH